MTDTLDIPGLRAKLATVTPGQLVVTECADVWVETQAGTGVALFGDISWLSSPSVVHSESEMKENAALFVALRNAAPALFDAAEERDDLRKMLAATVEQLELRKDTVLWRDMQEVMRQHNETIAERDALRAEVERLREALTAVDGIAWSVPFIESTESEALNKRLFDIRALTKAALAPEPTP